MQPGWRRWAARILARVIDASSWIGARTPAPLAHGLADLGGTIEWALRPRKRARLAANLCHAIDTSPDDPRVKRLVRREIRNEAHRSADLLWALGRPEEFLVEVEYDGIEHAQVAADAGCGVILVGTHLGGWEVATAVPGATLSVPTSVIVADDWLAWAIEHARVGAGLEVLYPEVAALRGVRLLRAGEAMLLLGDNSRFAQHTHRVRFLDSEADLAAGVVALARLSGSPIVAFTVLPLGPRRWRVTVDPPLDPPRLEDRRAGEKVVLQQLADRWSETIRAAPEHWAANHEIQWVEGDGGGAGP
jgi:lauroyl/myristoyl acyltransferase